MQGLKKERQPFFRRNSGSEVPGHSKLSRFARRGVTTMQPTLEDSSSSSASALNDSAAVQSGALSGGEERALSSDGGKMKLFPPSRAAAALIVGGEENLAQQKQFTAGADVNVADAKKKNLKLFSLQSKWTGKESASASKPPLLSSVDQGDRGRQVLSPEQIKIQSQISAKESELSKLDQEIQKKISSRMDPKSRKSNGKLLHSNSGGYGFFSPPKTAPHISNDEDLESLISLQVEVSAQLASLIETYRALSSELKISMNGSYLRQVVDITTLCDGTPVSDLVVPLHWTHPTR